MSAKHEYSTVIKCVIIGDSRTGKTNLLSAYWNMELPATYTMTVFDNYTAIVKVNEQQYLLDFWDSCGHRDYDFLRPLCYEGCDVFLLWYSSTNFSRLFPNVLVTFVIICYFCSFSLVDRASFENVSRRWVPEIRQYAPHTPFILVGNKLDQREKECTSHIDQTNNNTNTYHTDEQRVDQSEVISALSRTHRYSKILRLLERNNRSRIYSIPNPILPHFAKRNSETTQKKKKRLSFAFFKTLFRKSLYSNLSSSRKIEIHRGNGVAEPSRETSQPTATFSESFRDDFESFDTSTSTSANNSFVDDDNSFHLSIQKQRLQNNVKDRNTKLLKSSQNNEDTYHKRQQLDNCHPENSSRSVIGREHKAMPNTQPHSKGSLPTNEKSYSKSRHIIQNSPKKSKISSLNEPHLKQCTCQQTSSQLSNDSDIISLLPEEIILKVLRYLNDEDLCRCAAVSKLWLRMTNDDTLWMELLQRLVSDVNDVFDRCPIYKMYQRIRWKNLYLETLVEVEMHSPVWYSEGVQLAKEVGAVKYLENSALTKRGLKTGTITSH